MHNHSSVVNRSAFAPAFEWWLCEDRIWQPLDAAADPRLRWEQTGHTCWVSADDPQNATRGSFCMSSAAQFVQAFGLTPLPINNSRVQRAREQPQAYDCPEQKGPNGTTAGGWWLLHDCDS